MSQAPADPITLSQRSLGRGQQCPLCGGDNSCRVAQGHLYKGECWCFQIVVPSHLLRLLTESELEPGCLCRLCLETIAAVACNGDDTEAMLREIRAAVDQRKAATEGDYYLENGNVVFTAAYHLKRGACCGSGCRHCPY